MSNIGAWGGDPARKQSSIAAARATLAPYRAAMCHPALFLAATDGGNGPSNVYCAAFGTADPAEIEALSGLPVCVLLLASAALVACEHWGIDPGSDYSTPHLLGGAEEAPLAALQAIPVGVSGVAIARSYLVEVLERFANLLDHDGDGLSSGQRALVLELARLHGTASDDSTKFRTVRHAAISVANSATGEFESTILRFVESTAWPTAGLVAELPLLVSAAHRDLRACLAPERPTPAERRAMDDLARLVLEFDARVAADPSLELAVERRRLAETPESVAVYSSEFQARLRYYDRVAAEAYAPFAVDLLLEAFQNA